MARNKEQSPSKGEWVASDFDPERSVMDQLVSMVLKPINGVLSSSERSEALLLSEIEAIEIEEMRH